MSVKDQSYESRTAYQSYLGKFRYDTSASYQLNTEYYDSISMKPYTLNTYKQAHGSKASPIQIRVYNNEGKLINGYEQCFGDIKRLGILDSFPMKKIKHLPINYELKLNHDVNLFTNESADKDIILMESKRKKYTFIVFYSIWTGYYSEETLKKLKKHLKPHFSDIQLIMVNTSPMDIDKKR